MKKNFYITTPLYYINDKPHLGTTYTTILADVLARYYKLIGCDTFLLTGTDEHGQKSSQKAVAQGVSIQAYCDEMANRFKNIWNSLDISYNLFFRTTFPWHKKVVQKCLQELYNKNQVYESVYEGWYCTSEEIFYTSKDLVNGKSPSGKEVMKIKEKNYFFKMSAYQEKLIQHIQKNPDFIRPVSRKNEILGFLKKPLADLCITRPKTRLNWGVEVPFDTHYVTYVWVDALLNYATGVGYQSSVGNFQKWWVDAGALHLIGKDILITHAVYWPCLLMALGVRLPKMILAHGWLLNKEEKKMSKSFGDVMDPKELLKKYDSDSLRYFLMRDVPVGKDTPVSYELITRRVNEDLANNLGNLLRRTTKMIQTHFHSQVPEKSTSNNLEIQHLKNIGIDTAKKVKENILSLEVHLAINNVVYLLTSANQFLEKNAPWKKIKTGSKKETADILKTVLEIIYLSAVLLKPVMPQKMDTLLKSFSCPDEWPLEYFQDSHYPKSGTLIKDMPVLFPRMK